MKATYDGAVRYTDTVLGEFFSELKRLGVYDKATIMVTADHGEAFGEHGVFLHSYHFFEELIRVPFILRAPRMSRRGGYNPHLFQGLDLAPTILAHFGVGFKDPGEGVDMARFLGDASLNDPHRMVRSEYLNFGIKRRALRSYDRKVVLQEPADRAEFMATVGNPALLPSVNFEKEVVQCYDLRRDPFEKEPFSLPVGKSGAVWEQMKIILQKGGGSKARVAGRTRIKSLDPETVRDLEAMGYIQ
jgi:arylsulfatase A-like enzyme